MPDTLVRDRRRLGAGAADARHHEGADAEPDLGFRFHRRTLRIRAPRLPCRRRAPYGATTCPASHKVADFEQFQCVAESLERMQIVIGNVLSADEVALVREALARATFEDGRETAGFAARLVKNNRQAASDRKIETVRKLVEERILGNDVFALAVRPKALDLGDVLALRARHALRQPCRRRADAGHAHRRVVHAVPVRARQLRRRRAGDRERVGRGRREACRPAASSPIRRPRCITSPR